MIQTYSTTIRRKEMDAVLTCMVDEKIGPGELNARLIQTVKEFTKCDGAVALRSPAIALKYALMALDFEKGARKREFERLYRESYGSVYGYVRARMRDDASAEDVVAEAFCKAVTFHFQARTVQFPELQIKLSVSCVVFLRPI